MSQTVRRARKQKAFDKSLPSLSHSQRRKEKQQRSKQGRRLSADSWEAEVCRSLPDLRKQEQTQFITTSLQLSRWTQQLNLKRNPMHLKIKQLEIIINDCTQCLKVYFQYKFEVVLKRSVLCQPRWIYLIKNTVITVILLPLILSRNITTI